mgnify:CR=1 FL=1|tara:strand:- start:568 stop:876 length:309 start_codon:yes stop_codon:yes gene_type:complete
MPTVAPLRFELAYRREAYTIVRGEMVRDEAKDATLPARPPQFTPLTGAHGEVAERADELNKAQTRFGFIHYFFFPEVAGANTGVNPAHCDACKRISERPNAA